MPVAVPVILLPTSKRNSVVTPCPAGPLPVAQTNAGTGERAVNSEETVRKSRPSLAVCVHPMCQGHKVPGTETRCEGHTMCDAKVPKSIESRDAAGVRVPLPPSRPDRSDLTKGCVPKAPEAYGDTASEMRCCRTASKRKTQQFSEHRYRPQNPTERTLQKGVPPRRRSCPKASVRQASRSGVSLRFRLPPGPSRGVRGHSL